MSTAEEQVLLQRCRAGDAAAWDQFFDEHYAPLGRFVCQLVPDAAFEDVEEVCQDTLLAAIRSIGSFAGKSRVQTWLFRIATNKANDFRDRRLAAKRGGGRVPLSLDAEDGHQARHLEIAGAAVRPDETMIAAEAMAEVRRALDNLGEPCRGILELRYYADFDYETIGEALGLNSKTVSSRLSRCLDRLGSLLLDMRAEEAQGPAAV